jgi:hypothetical protein
VLAHALDKKGKADFNINRLRAWLGQSLIVEENAIDELDDSVVNHFLGFALAFIIEMLNNVFGLFPCLTRIKE